MFRKKMNNGFKIDCFVLAAGNVADTVSGLKACPAVSSVTLVETAQSHADVPGCSKLSVDSMQSSAAVKAIADAAKAPLTLLYTKPDVLQLGYQALERVSLIAADCGAGMLYADHYHLKGGVRAKAPVIDYQMGSLRDDFDFGSVLVFSTAALKESASRMTADYKAAGLYDLRLKLSQKYAVEHINEYLYTDVERDTRSSGQKIYDYCDPCNNAVQLEMEAACTDHLKQIGAYLAPTDFRDVDFDSEAFDVEATVVIPVLNRVRVIRDAIKSVLGQQADFKFNLIVVDNHSTDGTSEAIDEFSADPRLIHIIPERTDLGIGGCWNLAANDPRCGKFIIGLDSDDIYATPATLRTMVEQFYRENAAMVCGTYKMVDVKLNEIPPGIIDHHEWTPDNGRNNALHVNGFGGPRAFYTPIYRALQLPDTCYGEDYAMGLMVCRNYRVGRVYDVMTLARRWDDNTDANLDINKENANNLYKDRIRTWEVKARIQKNKKNKIFTITKLNNHGKN